MIGFAWTIALCTGFALFGYASGRISGMRQGRKSGFKQGRRVGTWWERQAWTEWRGYADGFAALEVENARLREALRPFAALADDYLRDAATIDDATIIAGRIPRALELAMPPRVVFSDFRRARAALEKNA
jgi:hypothetical protein